MLNDTVDIEVMNKASASELLYDTVFLQQLRVQMLKFSTLQLTDNGLAEDAVQEAFVGAIKNAHSFAGRAAFKTWVFAILKNKIADILRKRQRLNEASLLLQQHEEDEEFHELFNEKGFWHKDERPANWGNPEADMQDQHFWRVFEACLENLPSQQARVFMMREFIELESKEICNEVSISESNLHVMLHRARLRLRECLENNWFQRGVNHA